MALSYRVLAEAPTMRQSENPLTRSLRMQLSRASI